MKAIEIQKLKKDELFILSKEVKISFNTVYSFDGYCRYNKKYTGTQYGDINKQIYKKKNTIVYIDFEF